MGIAANALGSALGHFTATARTPRLRPMLEWAQEEVILPEGRWKDLRWKPHRQPYQRAWLAAIDSYRWKENNLLAIVQGGKSLAGFVIPTLYHLYETKETVILGAPTLDIAHDKWREEIEPVIKANPRLRELLPTHGAGSRGGFGTAIKFRHGVTLKFMTGGGGDDKRSSFTARVVVITEADKFDTAGVSSREANPIKQLKARTFSYPDEMVRIYAECTVSIEEGYIWQQHLLGTGSKLVVPCCHCGAWVSPQREHLGGWQDAESDRAAKRGGHFFCPSCGELWTETQRAEMNARQQLLHRGQTIDREGVIHGEAPDTDVFSLHANAFCNLFRSAGEVAAAEWKAQRAEDPDDSEKEMRQFYWVLPAEPDHWDQTPITSREITEKRHVDKLARGLVPAAADVFTLGVDVGKWSAYYTASGFSRKTGSEHVVDYGIFDVPSSSMNVEAAVLAALRTFRDEKVAGGWLMPDGSVRHPDRVLIDAGYMTDEVYDFCRESVVDDKWLFVPSKGLGSLQQSKKQYQHPKKTGALVKTIGEEWHLARFPGKRVWCVLFNTDHWKSKLHTRLVTPPEQPGEFTIFQAMPREHTTFAKHLTNEKVIEEHVPGRGIVQRWVNEGRKPNHWLDSTVLADVAASLQGIKIARGEGEPGVAAAPAQPAPSGQQLMRSDGLSFLVTDRR